MSDGKYLIAHTTCDKDEYNFYPPYANFTQYGDMVRITVRSRDYFDEVTGHWTCGPTSQMEITVPVFRNMLHAALEKLDTPVVEKE